MNAMSRKHVIPILLGGLLMAGSTACASNSSSSNPSPSPEAQGNPEAQAVVIYQNFCVSCHGINLEGFKSPNLQKVGERLTEEQIFTQIQKGSEGMPGFKVSIKEQDIHLLAEWLAAKK
jgi:cytochrome c551